MIQPSNGFMENDQETLRFYEASDIILLHWGE